MTVESIPPMRETYKVYYEYEHRYDNVEPNQEESQMKNVANFILKPLLEVAATRSRLGEAEGGRPVVNYNQF